MENFATIVNGFQLLIIVVKLFILDVIGGPGYASETTSPPLLSLRVS